MSVIKQQVHVMSLQILHVPLIGIKYVPFFKMLHVFIMGHDNGIATRYGLHGPAIESWRG
jgi:hypothetical protein